jgi:hypothetical protein
LFSSQIVRTVKGYKSVENAETDKTLPAAVQYLTRCLPNRGHKPGQYPLININFSHTKVIPAAGTCSALAVYHMVSSSSAHVCHGSENSLIIVLLLSREILFLNKLLRPISTSLRKSTFF